MSTGTLTTNPESYAFAADELPELNDMLAVTDRSTVISPVTAAADLCFTETGTLPGGYLYTGASFMQLCGLVSPGLSQLVQELSGQWRKVNDDIRLYSKELAIDVFNKIVRLRFDRVLSGMQLVRNTRAKTIDGIVGAKYRYLANSDFLSRVFRECVGFGATYASACLYGRQFVVRFVGTTQPVTIQGDTYHRGYHFANSEIGGQAVRAAMLLIKHGTNYSAMCPFADGGGRVVHSGRDFEKRLHALVENIITQAPNHDDLSSSSKVLSKSLGLGNSDHIKRLAQLSTILTRKGITQSLTQRILLSTAAQGSSDTDVTVDLAPSERVAIWQQRTGYDLFVALIRNAVRLPIEQREVVEQVAYNLLIGKTTL